MTMLGFRSLSLWALIFTLVGAAATFAQDSPEEGPALAVRGVVGPKSVVLTRAHPTVTKPVAVILQNQSFQPVVLPDAAVLRSTVALQVQLKSTPIPDPEVVFTAGRNFPFTLQPQGKMLVVFQVKLALGDARPGRVALGYSAAVNEDALASAAGDAPAAAPIIVRGADKGAVVQVTRQFVGLRKGSSLSDPITCTSKWDRAYFVSGWAQSPPNQPADDACDKAYAKKSVTLRWSKPGNYVVKAYLVDNDSGIFAEPSIDTHVVRMSFTDESTLRVGITTPLRVRQKSVSIRVEPSSEANNVTLEVKGEGSSRLMVVGGKQVNGGTVTFMVEGTGAEGSLSEGDTELEAKISTVPGYSVTRKVTVTRPFRISDESGDNFTGGNMFSGDIAVGQGTVLPASGVATGQHALVSWYGWRIHVHVTDRFGRDVDDLYAGEPVSEVFVGDPVIHQINVHLQPGSFYVDWVGYQVAPPGTQIVPAGSPDETAWTSHTTATHPLPPTLQQIIRVQLTSRLGPFALVPNLVRTTILNNGTLRVGSTGHDTGHHIGGP